MAPVYLACFVPTVVHILASAQPRGAERFGLDLATAMTDRGAATRVVALEAGRRSPRLDVDVLGRWALSPRALSRLRAAVPRDGVAVAHGSTALPACAAALIRGAPFIYRGIGDPQFWASSRSRRWRVRRYLARAAAVVAMWPSAADALRDLFGVPTDRVHMIPKGITTSGTQSVDGEARRAARRRIGIPENVAVVAYLGSLSPEKDPLLAIESCARLGGAVHLLVIGDGPLRHAVEARAAGILGDRAWFVGQVDDPLRSLAAADTLVLSSRTEGIPSAPLEAALLGIPAVVTDVGGAKETVVDDETGRVVQAGDPVVLASAIADALARARAMGSAARSRCVATFDIRAVAERWLALCHEVQRNRAGTNDGRP